MIERSAETSVERRLAWLMLAMALVLVILQMRSLFIFPEPNSLRWFGDETWLMSEAKQQISTGIVCYPIATGSSLESGKGLVLSMTWLSSLIYGLPVYLAGHSVVADGRIVTAFISIVLSAFLFLFARKFGASQFAASFAVLLLVSSRSLFFASHSARPDILAGLFVLAFVATCTKLTVNNANRSVRWWIAFGAIISFISVTSSIHLLTLIAPVSILFIWKLGGFNRAAFILSTVIGAISILILLAAVYFITSGSLTLFSHSAGHVQFQDVLSSIPILRPFSRSVQFANIIIRLKQFWGEAPQIFLFPLIWILIWSKRPRLRSTFAIASLIVFFSWLLLEGAEINYSMQILPLLFLGLAIVFSKLEKNWRFTIYAAAGVAVIFFILGCRDSAIAYDNSSRIEESNSAAVRVIENAIDSTWHGAEKPRVVTEPPMLERLLSDRRIIVMTDHFISFPTRVEPLDSFFAREHVNYIALYNSPSYPKNRPRDDPFYKEIASGGNLIATEIGFIGDAGRDYFGHSDWRDTLLLFKLPEKP